MKLLLVLMTVSKMMRIRMVLMRRKKVLPRNRKIRKLEEKRRRSCR